MDLAVFDLDGTLVDTAPDLIDTCNAVLARHDVAPVLAAVLRPHIGLGARRMIEVTLAEAGRTMTPDEVGAVHSDYLAHYAARLARLSRPYPEMLACLDALERDGVALAVCTNKREWLARDLLGRLGLAHRFRAVAGADTFAAMKPDPRHLLLTIGAAGGDAGRTVFVGDSRVDFETSRAAAIPFVGLTWGYSEVAMTALDPDVLVGPGGDVAAAVMSLLPGRDPPAPGTSAAGRR